MAKSRFGAQLKKYKDTNRDLNDVMGRKFRLRENELKAGVTIEIKLDKLFPQFQRWDTLFQGRQNISPSFTMEPGVNIHSDTCMSSVMSSIRVHDPEEREMVVLPEYELSDANDQPDTVDPPEAPLNSFM